MELTGIPGIRLHNQKISYTEFKKPEEIVSYLGAVQSQDFLGAKWALGLRLPGSIDSEIEATFNAGKILRTHVLRPTWHFVAPENIRWMLELSKPQVIRLMSYYNKQLELDETVFKRANQVFQTTLKGSNFLTRKELSGKLSENGIKGTGQRIGHIIMNSEIEGIICSGPLKGKQFTYALIDDVAPKTKPLSRDEALSKLAEIFFKSRGPATIKDFSKWSGLTQADAKKGLDSVKTRFQSEVMDGKQYFFSALKSSIVSLKSALLLPNYDEYISSYADYTVISNAQTRANLEKIGNAVFWNHMVLNGNIVGSWRRVFKPKVIEIELAPLINLSIEESAAFEKAADCFGDFFQMKVALR